jgi:outer membrane lipoprotein SlyB
MRGVGFGTAGIALLALAGCAVAPPTGPSVTVMPGQGKSFEAFQADDVSCRQYAAQQTGIAPGEAANQSLVGSAAVGTVLGAAAGAAIGAATGNPAAGAAIGAGSGAVLGTGYGLGAAQYSGSSVQYRYDVGYVQCMSAKGDNVPQMPAAQTAYAAPAYPYAYAPYPYYPAYPYYYRPWYGPTIGFGFGFHNHFRRR